MRRLSSGIIVVQLIFALISGLAAQTVGELSPTNLSESTPPSPFEAFSEHFHKKTDSGLLPGTVMLLSRSDAVWSDVYGKQNIAGDIPMSEKTIFRIASMTKPIVSAAAMMLVEQGKLKLDDPVEKYVPAFAKVQVLNNQEAYETPRRSITVLNLLTHTSGIANNMFRNTPAEKVYGEVLKTKRPTSLKALVDIIASLPLAHHPNEHWTYGYSTDVLARVIEIASGEPIDAFLQNHIFHPLNMSDTGFLVPQEKLSRFAAAYGRDLTLFDAGDKNSPYANGDNISRGAGGLVSTANDYLRFCKMLLNGGELEGRRLLKAETVEMMMKNNLPSGVLPHIPNMPPLCNGFGLGFGVQTNDAVFGNSGDCAWPGAYLTYFFIDRQTKSIGIFMTQNADLANLAVLAEFHQMGSELMKGAKEIF